MANKIQDLNSLGQSVWLDYIRRGIIESGKLEALIRDGLVYGVTSNPTIFKGAIAGSDDYEAALAQLALRENLSSYEAFLELGGEDVRRAADLLRPVYEKTEGIDGYVSFEAQEGSRQEILAEAQRMFALVDRPNLMIKVPGIPEGIAAVPDLIATGINVNITLLFDVAVYGKVVEAYFEGLERRLAAGSALNSIASVASFFVSRVDTKVDALLPEGSPLRGKIAIANAWKAYKLFLEATASERWQKLAAAGAHPQRPLWASTGTKNAAYSDVLYVDGLVAAQTVNTLPEATLQAFIDHGKPISVAADGVAESASLLQEASAAGVDLEAVTSLLLQEGLAAFSSDFSSLLTEIERRLAQHSGAVEARTQ